LNDTFFQNPIYWEPYFEAIAAFYFNQPGLYVRIDDAALNTYSVQMLQRVPFFAGIPYRLTVRMRTEVGMSRAIQLNNDRGPEDGYANMGIDNSIHYITGEFSDVVRCFFAPVTDTTSRLVVNMGGYLANSTADVWIESILLQAINCDGSFFTTGSVTSGSLTSGGVTSGASVTTANQITTQSLTSGNVRATTGSRPGTSGSSSTGDNDEYLKDQRTSVGKVVGGIVAGTIVLAVIGIAVTIVCIKQRS